MDLEYVPIMKRPRTLLIDLDGCIFRQGNRWPDIAVDPVKDLLPGVKKKLAEANLAGHKIIILTARTWPEKSLTERQLREAGVKYDTLICGLPTGQRILINDRKNEEDTPMAVAVNLRRDEGLEGVEL